MDTYKSVYSSLLASCMLEKKGVLNLLKLHFIVEEMQWKLLVHSNPI